MSSGMDAGMGKEVGAELSPSLFRVESVGQDSGVSMLLEHTEKHPGTSGRGWQHLSEGTGNSRGFL